MVNLSFQEKKNAECRTISYLQCHATPLMRLIKVRDRGFYLLEILYIKKTHGIILKTCLLRISLDNRPVEAIKHLFLYSVYSPQILHRKTQPFRTKMDIYSTLCEFFLSVLTDGFSLKFEWQQIFSGLQDFSQYSSWFYNSVIQSEWSRFFH